MASALNFKKLCASNEFLKAYPCSATQVEFIGSCRLKIQKIISRADPRFLLVVGPCSIHSTQEGLEYANRLSKLADHVQSRIMIVMRAYFEKPRTEQGWPGFALDPHLDNSFDIEYGVTQLRIFYQSLLDLRLPIACELLDLSLVPYFEDLICWGALGARTVESSVHRRYLSGTAFPVGVKNSTEGSILKAVQALKVIQSPQPHLQQASDGSLQIQITSGNMHTHLILRGGHSGPNYTAPFLSETATLLRDSNLTQSIMVDCNHGNSQKVAKNQIQVIQDVFKHYITGNSDLIGAMIESYIHEGKQTLNHHSNKLQYGISVTDPCLSWETTEQLILQLYKDL